jgi:hypothetical protein
MMDHRQFVRAVEIMRAIAARVGPQHAYWDLVFDAEAMLEGRETVLQRHEIVAAVEREMQLVQ